MTVPTAAGERHGAGRRLDRIAAVLSGAYLAAMAGLLAARWMPALLAPVLAVSFFALNVLGAASAVRASRLPRLGRRARRAWQAVAASFAVLTVACILFGDGAGSFPRPGDIARLLFVPVLLAGLVAFPTTSGRRRDRYKLFLDAGIVVAASSMLLWYIEISPAISVHGIGTAALVAAIAYPLGDLVLIFGATTVLMGACDRSVRQPLIVLAVGLVFFVAGDAYLGYQASVTHADVTIATWQFACWLTGTFLMGMAGCVQCRQPGGHRRRPDLGTQILGPQILGPQILGPQIRGISWLPYLVVGMSYLLLVAVVGRGNLFPAGGLVVGAVLTSVLVVSRQIVALRENREMASTDDLTGLANRTLLYDVLRGTLDRSESDGEIVAVLVADLDDFKHINDTLGHEAGDQALLAFGELLRQVARGSDVVARLGGDEFAIVLRDIDRLESAAGVAQRIVDQASRPVLVGNVTVHVRASIGVVVCRPGELGPDEVMRRADIAMQHAKRQRAGSWQVYEDGMALADGPGRLEAELHAAVAFGELTLHYQPIVAIDTGELIGAEALVRWQHPTRGLVSPEEFIPLAEQTGLIVPIGTWVLERACRQMIGWQRRLPDRRLQLCVNLSPRQLIEDSLVRDVFAVLRHTGFDPSELVLEVTEGALVQGPAAVRQLEYLHRAGIGVALDDFGTGYSSLRYLTRLPVDILKLDRCFVAELDGSRKGAAVAEAVVRLGDVLRLDVVAEGVETVDQARELFALGYRTAQGYHFSRPLTESQMSSFVDQRAGQGPRPPAARDLDATPATEMA
jgi:diguanylate cyclase (GGDEF)-like protein